MMPTAIEYPPIPDVPAFWSWELPAFPLPCELGLVRAWQEGRCAVCAVQIDNPSLLFEDHDHATGDTRGYLCTRCNTAEGQHWAPPVFDLYRKRYPTLVLGVLHKRGRTNHPLVDGAITALYQAFEAVAYHTDDSYRARSLADAARLRAAGLNQEQQAPAWTPLAEALHRVGLTGREYGDMLDERKAISMAQQVCLPGYENPPVTACKGYPWTPPPRAGQMRRACPECFRVSPERMRRMIGDGFGRYPGEEADALIAAASRWRDNPKDCRCDHA